MRIFHMNELISIIIPVYNVEAYLERCVKSVTNQTYKNIEIILVDDGSPDNSPAICDRLALSDDRIKVLHKENGGLSDARNCGVEKAEGRYVTFIDSDDYISRDYIEYLYGLLVNNGADISSCGMVDTTEDMTEFPVDASRPDALLMTGKEACGALLGELYMSLVTACGRLYKMEVVKKHLFPKGKKHEDEATTAKYYYESERVVLGNRSLYAYYQNPNSITRAKSDKLNEDLIWALEHRALFFEERGEEALAASSWSMYFYFCLNDSLSHGGRSDVYLKKLLEGRSLSKRVLLEARLYFFSRTVFKIYFKLKNLLRKALSRG